MIDIMQWSSPLGGILLALERYGGDSRKIFADIYIGDKSMCGGELLLKSFLNNQNRIDNEQAQLL